MLNHLDLNRFPDVFETVLQAMPQPVADGWRVLFAAEPGLELQTDDDADGWLTVVHRGVTVMQIHADTFTPTATEGETLIRALIMVDGQAQQLALPISAP